MIVDELVLKLTLDDRVSADMRQAAQQVRDFGQTMEGSATKSDQSYSKIKSGTQAFRDSFNSEFGALGTDVRDFEGMMAGLGGVAAGGLKALGDGVVTSIQKYAQFESAMAGVRRTTGLAGEDFEALSISLRRMATVDLQGMSTAEDLAAIAEAAGMLGIQGLDNIQAFTKDVAQISVALDVTAEKAGENLARIANQFKTSLEQPRTYIDEFGQTIVEDFGGAYEQVGRIGSAMNDVSQNTTATVTDIMNMTQRMSGAATTMGLTVDNVIALSGVMRDVGLGVEKGSTAMNQLMLSMIKNTDSYVDAFHLNAEEFTDAVQNEPMKAIAMLAEGMGKLKDSEGPKALTVAIESLLGKGDGITQLALKLAGSEEKLIQVADVSSEAFRENTSVVNEFGTAADTQLGKWGAMQEKSNELFRSFGEELKPATDAVLGFGNNVLDALLSAADAWRSGIKEHFFDALAESWLDIAASWQKGIEDLTRNTLAALKKVRDAVTFVDVSVDAGMQTDSGEQSVNGMISAMQGLQTSNSDAFAQSEELRSAYGSLYKELASQADKSVAPNERLQGQFQALQYELGQIEEVGWKNSVFPDLRSQVDMSVQHVQGLETALSGVSRQMDELTTKLQTMQQMQSSVGSGTGSAGGSSSSQFERSGRSDTAEANIADYKDRKEYASELKKFYDWGADRFGNLNPARFEAYLVKKKPELLEAYNKFGIHMPAVMHAGGPVRYHNGGLAGDEVPAILQTGEYVLSRSDVADVRSGRAGSVVGKVRASRFHDGGPVEGGMSAGQSVSLNFNFPDARVVDGAAFQRFARDIKMEIQRQGGLIYST